MNGQRGWTVSGIRPRRPDSAAGHTARRLMALSVLMLAAYLVIGAGSFLQSRHSLSAGHAAPGWIGALPGHVLVDMLARETGVPPADRTGRPASGTSAGSAAGLLLRLVAGIDPADPKTLLAGELPALKPVAADPGFVAGGTGSGGGQQGPRHEGSAPPAVHPPSGQELADGPEDGLRGDLAGSAAQPGQAGMHPAAQGEADPFEADPGWADGFAPPVPVDPEALFEIVDNGRAGRSGSYDGTGGTSAFAKRVFIYHTHNRESFLPELKPGLRADEAQDDEINVTLAGRRLAERLEELGIGAVASDTDYPSVIEDFNWNESYRYSLQTVREAFAAHPELRYFLDIHRDAAPRRSTTVTIDGKAYAQVYFIIGRSNPNWEQNERLAREIHDRLEAGYPGISRGVLGKRSGSGNNGEYNQSFSPGSLLIEVGGVENSLEEVYRTIDILAGVLADVILNAERV